MRRRLAFAFLGVALLGLLSGCSAAGSLEMVPVDDASLADEASHDVPRPLPPGKEGPPRRAVVTGAIENGSATVTGQSPPVDAELPFEHEGTYYAVGWTVVDREEATRVDIGIDYNGTADGRAVAYDDLPAVDREALDSLLPPRDRNRVEGVDIGVGATYTDAELNESTLAAGGYDAVSYEGEQYPVRVEQSRTVTVQTYRYTATEAAANASAYAAQLREAYAFTLDTATLDGDALDVVESSIDETYYADSTDDDAFRSVQAAFREHQAIENDDVSGLWLVRYDGELYAADLRYGQFAD
jgi:hypothetical protein